MLVETERSGAWCRWRRREGGADLGRPNQARTDSLGPVSPRPTDPFFRARLSPEAMAEGPTRVGLIVGRFQPLHWGHVRLIEWIRADGARPLVGLGSSQFSHTRENPFTADERRRMIQAADQALGLKVGAVEEVPDIFDDTRWVQHVEGCVGHFDVVYSNNEWTSGLFTAAGYEVRPAPLFERERLEGAKIRLLIKERGLEAVAELIPEPVMAVLKELEAEKRVRGCWATETPAAR